MRNYKNYTTEDFINDKHFVNWVLNPDEKGDSLFSELQKQYPEKKDEMMEAAFLIKSMQPIEPEISSERLSRIWLEINQNRKSKSRNLFISVLKYAAVFIFFIIVGGGVYYYLIDDSVKLQPSITGIESNQKGQIILSDGTVKYFDTERTRIKQLPEGITINDDTLKCKEEMYNHSKSALNHIILPYGMRSDVFLSDGTHVFLNSGSKFSYPDKFEGHTRKVYLSGEAFLEVNKDNKRPFYVYTNDVRVKVMGTSFNVSSYTNDQTVQVVLVEGKVNIKKNNLLSQSMDILPGERAVFNKKTEVLTKGKVDIKLYTSWIHGYLVFEKAPITDVAKKLERYYKRKITVSKDIRKITFSGKLDLSKEVDDVLEYISFASAIDVHKENECVILKP